MPFHPDHTPPLGHINPLCIEYERLKSYLTGLAELIRDSFRLNNSDRTGV